ncbi:MAG: hypothetical protein FWH15_07740 [Betaproteobacteria bacterium]|nr:hypothetical protein [Betaproteobacteria bacterium]
MSYVSRRETAASIKKQIVICLQHLLTHIEADQVDVLLNNKSLWAFSPAGDDMGYDTTFLCFSDYKGESGNASLHEMLSYWKKLKDDEIFNEF